MQQGGMSDRREKGRKKGGKSTRSTQRCAYLRMQIRRPRRMRSQPRNRERERGGGRETEGERENNGLERSVAAGDGSWKKRKTTRAAQQERPRLSRSPSAIGSERGRE